MQLRVAPDGRDRWISGSSWIVIVLSLLDPGLENAGHAGRRQLAHPAAAFAGCLRRNPISAMKSRIMPAPVTGHIIVMFVVPYMP